MSWSAFGYLVRGLGSSDSMAQRIDWNPREWVRIGLRIERERGLLQ